MINHSSSGPVDPLLGYTLFPKNKVLLDPSTPYDFDHDLQAINNHLKSMTSLNGLKDHAKNILSGTSGIQKSDMSRALKCLNEDVPAIAVENHQKRRPAFGRKRARFSLKPNLTQPDMSLQPTFNFKKYKDPGEYFKAYERHENAKIEMEKKMGGTVLDADQQNPSSITRPRRLGLSLRSVKYKHLSSSHNNEICENAISSQETFETSILSPLNHSSQTESHENFALEDMDLAGSKVKEDNKWNKNILDELLSQPAEDLKGDGALRLLTERLQMKHFEVENICLPEFQDTWKADLKPSRRPSLKPGPVKPRQGQEGSIHLGSPTLLKSPLASLSLLRKRSLLSNPSNDLFSAYDIDQLPVTSPSDENRNKQSDLIDIAEQTMISDELKSPSIKQNDKIEGAKTGSPEVVIEESTNALERSKRDSLRKLGVGCDVDTEEEVGGSKLMSETLTRPEDDADTSANGVNNNDKVEDKLQDAGPELNVADSTLEKFNGAQSQVADDVIDSDEIQEEDKLQEAMPEHNVVDSTLEKLNGAQSQVADIVMNYDEEQEQDKLQQAVACADKGLNVADSTVEKLNDAPSQLDQLHSAPVEEHTRDGLSRNLDIGLEKPNEVMQEHSGVSLNKPIDANSRSRRKKKSKEVSKRQSLAGHGTSWKSGVRQSTRIRTRPLEYWKGERLLYGRIHDSLPTVIGMKYASPGKGEEKASLKVKSFVSDKHKVLVDLVSLH